MKKLGYQLPFYLAIFLYLVSLGLTILTTSNGNNVPGVFGLFGGWMTLVYDMSSFVAWLANITFFIALFSVAKKKKPKIRRGLIYL